MSQQKSQIPQEIPLREIPKFEFTLHDDELINCIKQLSQNMKYQDKNIQKIKKQSQNYTKQPDIIQMINYINTSICIDPTLKKQQGKYKYSTANNNAKKQINNNRGINNSAGELGKKINEMAQILLHLHTTIKNIQKRTEDKDENSKRQLVTKISQLQKQLREEHNKQNKQIKQIRQKIQKDMTKYTQKISQIQKNTLWQINDCKSRLNYCINQQYVKDSIKQFQIKINHQNKGNPGKQFVLQTHKIQEIQHHVMKIQKYFYNHVNQNQHKIQNVKDCFDKVVFKKQFGQEKIQIDKKFTILNSFLNQTIKRIAQLQSQLSDQKKKVRKIQQFQQHITRQTHKIHQALKNLKLGQETIKMLQKIDPHKICQLVDRTHDLTLGQQKIIKMIDTCQKQVDQLRSKTQFTSLISPSLSPPSSKYQKQQINELISEYMMTNPLIRKIQNIQSQVIDVKMFPQMMNNINKQIIKLQKQIQHTNLNYEYKSLQQYIKKQILLLNNRINSIELLLKQQKKRANTANKIPHIQQKLSSSVSYKKLTPANCISCFVSTQLPSNFSGKKNILHKL